MTELVLVYRGLYRDSVTLMGVSRAAATIPGADDVAVVMATPLNLELLAKRGFVPDDVDALTPNDLVIAARAVDGSALSRVQAAIEQSLNAGDDPSRQSAGATDRGGRATAAAVSLRTIARSNPNLNLALLSVPGAYVAHEAAAAIDAGMHVFCFSDGVSIDAERALKRHADARGLLFMGPDCGTALIDGVALGFANAVERGPVGIVGASGTGIQEVSCLLDVAGVGVSHAIGVGGRDLSAEVAGLMFRRALQMLATDPDTAVIVAIAKAADPTVADSIRELSGRLGKPVVLGFLGLRESEAQTPPAKVTAVTSLAEAAARAAELVGRRLPTSRPATASRSDHAGGVIRGLFSGGTLCVEAMSIVARSVGRVWSNVPLEPDWRVDGPAVTPDPAVPADGHLFVDFGADEFTIGRPHPMIDPTLRLERFAIEARRSGVAVTLLDLVLGYAADPDPAASWGSAIARARSDRPELQVIVSLCGTARDPQDLDRQRDELADAGALVTSCVADAARLALGAVAGAEESRADW